MIASNMGQLLGRFRYQLPKEEKLQPRLRSMAPRRIKEAISEAGHPLSLGELAAITGLFAGSVNPRQDLAITLLRLVQDGRLMRRGPRGDFTYDCAPPLWLQPLGSA